MPSRTGPNDSQPQRIHLETLRICTHESDGPLDILHLFGDFELRLRTRHDREHRVTTIEKDLIITWPNRHHQRRLFAGEPTAIHQKQHSATVWFRGLKDIHRQSHTKFATVNHILRPPHTLHLPIIRDSGVRQSNKQREENKDIEPHDIPLMVFIAFDTTMTHQLCGLFS